MVAIRPEPDERPRRVWREGRGQARGRLTIFFGAAPGVGKTATMLRVAGALRGVEGRDVVAGVVETRGCPEATAMLAGFEILPRRTVNHGGGTLEEFDLDAALARKPSLLLLDELAHANAPGSRHAKRWQDAEELLDTGIDVYTTLDVQHVESLNDVVTRDTGVVVRERCRMRCSTPRTTSESSISPAAMLVRPREEWARVAGPGPEHGREWPPGG